MTTNVKLDQESSQAVLEQAIHTHAQLVLEAPAFGRTTISGYLISGDDSALLMEITGQSSVPIDRILNVRCDVRLFTERRYGFPAVVQAVPSWGNCRCVALSRPQTISLFERRRFLRAKLAPSTRVGIEWRRDGADHRHEADMLNVSPEGLACRVENSVAQVLDKGGTVVTRFKLPPMREPLELIGTICNQTPASEGYTILGLHFEQISENSAGCAALRDALGESEPVAATEAYA